MTRRPRLERWAKALAGTLGLAGLVACSSKVQTTKIEDRARRNVPIPICLQSLERRGVAGVVSSLKPEDYWSIVLPGFDAASSSLDTSAPNCAGRPAFDPAELRDVEGPRAGNIPVKVDQAMVAAGPDGFRVVWLKTHELVGGHATGPLALLRPREGYAEVYAIGTYRGNPKTSRFSLERMGPHLLIAATDDGCAKVEPNKACETQYSVYLLRAGHLLRAATFPLDRIEYRHTPGSGLAEFRLTATPVFQESSLRVVEQVVVRDGMQNTIRKADLERVFTLRPDGTLVASAESLWAEISDGR
ncbi:MAG: hypothetical protein DIU78_006705 [Pseudomonadota bacterium]|nr:MAG: hypothetical protein DIU78_05710 [Pseudomonadota bacterium]